MTVLFAKPPWRREEEEDDNVFHPTVFSGQVFELWGKFTYV